MHNAMKLFLKLTFSDIQCLMYYFVSIVSSILLYAILIAQGNFNSESLTDMAAVLLILPVILLVMLPFLYTRFKTLNTLLRSNNKIRVRRDEYRCRAGPVLIQCSIFVYGDNKEILLIGSDRNRRLADAGEFNVIVDKRTGEAIIYEAFL